MGKFKFLLVSLFIRILLLSASPVSAAPIRCLDKPPVCAKGREVVQLALNCGQQENGHLYSCVTALELDILFSRSESQAHQWSGFVGEFTKVSVGQIKDEGLTLARQNLRLFENNGKNIEEVAIRDYCTHPGLAKRCAKLLLTIKNTNDQLKGYRSDLDARDLLGRISDLAIQSKESVKRELSDVVAETAKIAQVLASAPAVAVHCVDKEQARVAALNQKAFDEITEQVRSGFLHPADMARLYVYSPIPDVATKERILEQLRIHNSEYFDDLQDNLIGYKIAEKIYGSLIPGHDQVLKESSRNLDLEAERIEAMLKINLESIADEFGVDSDVYIQTLDVKNRLNTYRRVHLGEPATTPIEIKLRFEILRKLNQEYKNVDHDKNRTHADRIDTLETIASVATDVKGGLRFAAIAAASYASGGLLGGAVGAGFDALDSIAGQGILDGKVDWTRVATHSGRGALEGLFLAGSGGLVKSVAEKVGAEVVALGASELAAKVTTKGVAAVVGYELSGVASAGGSMAETAVLRTVKGQEVTADELSEAGLAALKANHTLRGLITAAGGMAIHASMAKVPIARPPPPPPRVSRVSETQELAQADTALADTALAPTLPQSRAAPAPELRNTTVSAQPFKTQIDGFTGATQITGSTITIDGFTFTVPERTYTPPSPDLSGRIVLPEASAQPATAPRSPRARGPPQPGAQPVPKPPKVQRVVFDLAGTAESALSAKYGQPVKVGSEVGRGGMRTVFEVEGMPGKLAKVFDPAKVTSERVARRIQTDLLKEDYIQGYLDRYQKQNPGEPAPLKVARTNRDPKLIDRGVIEVERAAGRGLTDLLQKRPELINHPAIQRAFKAIREMEPHCFALEKQLNNDTALAIQLNQAGRDYVKAVGTNLHTVPVPNSSDPLAFFGLDVYGTNNLFFDESTGTVTLVDY